MTIKKDIPATNSMEDTYIASKKRFSRSLFILVLSLIYLALPIDILPDILGPIGMIDDIPLLLGSALYSWFSYRKMKKKQTQ